MAEDHAGHFQAGGQEHGGPDDAVKAGDVLADDVHISRPELGEEFVIPAEADGRYVIDQGVKPDVDHMVGLDRQGDSPIEGRA